VFSSVLVAAWVVRCGPVKEMQFFMPLSSLEAHAACMAPTAMRRQHDCVEEVAARLHFYFLFNFTRHRQSQSVRQGVHTARERRLGCQKSRGYAAGKVKDEEHELARLEGQSMAARFLSKHRPTTVSSPLEQVRVGVPPKALTMALEGGGWG
jgi:hypothetical protein